MTCRELIVKPEKTGSSDNLISPAMTVCTGRVWWSTQLVNVENNFYQLNKSPNIFKDVSGKKMQFLSWFYLERHDNNR